MVCNLDKYGGHVKKEKGKNRVENVIRLEGDARALKKNC